MLLVQVTRLKVVGGEEEVLRGRLRQIEARRSSLQQCTMVRQGLSGAARSTPAWHECIIA
jgi:hypothetical protein